MSNEQEDFGHCWTRGKEFIAALDDLIDKARDVESGVRDPFVSQDEFDILKNKMQEARQRVIDLYKEVL